MEILKSIPFWIIGILMLGLLILVHEFGHYITGRLLKFKINEFSVGMGPKLFSKEKNGIVYSLRAVPLGGFVAFHGEDEETENDPQAMNNMAWWKRAIVMFSGAGFNIIFAFVVTALLICGIGYSAPKLSIVNENTPAAEVLQVDDIIYSVNGKQVLFPGEMSEMLQNTKDDEPINLTVIRDGNKVDVTTKRYFDAENNKHMLGITFSYDTLHPNFFESFSYSAKYNWYMTEATYKFLGQLVSGKADINQVTGPISTIGTIGGYVKEVAEAETVSVGERIRDVIVLIVNFLAIISMNLAVMNLLPLPALDGFRLLFALIEGITGKHINRKAEGIINAAGLFVLIGLVAALEISKLF